MRRHHVVIVVIQEVLFRRHDDDAELVQSLLDTTMDFGLVVVSRGVDHFIAQIEAHAESCDRSRESYKFASTHLGGLT